MVDGKSFQQGDDGKYYHISPIEMTWEKAKSFCHDLNAILAHADTESDFSAIKKILFETKA